MAWCEECSRHIDDDELDAAGACPDCSSITLARRPIPWHFKLLIVATVIYLGYRTFQGVTWVLHHV